MAQSPLRWLVKTILLPLLILIIGFGIFNYLKNTKPVAEPVDIEERAWPVEVLSLNTQQTATQLSLVGRVETQQRIRLHAPLNADLVSLPRQVGERFEAGAELMAFDDRQVAWQLQAAQADFNEAQALFAAEEVQHVNEREKLTREAGLLALKQTDLQRNQQLVARELASQQVVDQAQEALNRQELTWLNAQLQVEQQTSRLAQAQARLDRAQVQLDTVQRQAEQARYIAPMPGRIMARHAAEGEPLTQNSPVLDFYSLDSLELRVTLPLDQVATLQAAIAQAQPISGQLLGTDEPLEFSRFDAVASVRGLDAWFAFTLPTQSRPGEMREMRVSVPLESPAFAVPYSALYGQNRVYVIDSERLVAREVKRVGDWMQGTQRWALVVGELALGEQLLVTQLPNAVGGLRVRPLNE
ncbi:efflux RND transporter periplasmic adaptor subunit [Thiomicrospira cyclica]|uniref:Secretion protein HlyD n=1 Tax=Thiomicrospira cyclica (strain DSM 14477 / JCM 11371 / ALM1) TaxID=717773 RepID=F6D931_THICA|nr:secretion protein HlyD [Thiomicrospira cyclica]AEG30862.1 secretion protein HlyD [Thiomicrospira cyclica ALM1]